MRRLCPVLAVLSLLAAAPAAAAQSQEPPPAPVLVSPQDAKQYPPPLRGVTFKVKGLRSERAGALRIQFTDADGTVDDTGRFQAEGGVDDFELKQAEPGSTLYKVRVPASTFRRYGDRNFYWQAYRLLAEGSCRRMQSGKDDCFQQSKRRTFELLDPAGYGSFEPNNSPAKATTDFFNSGCAYLEKRDDVDWFRHDGVSKPRELRLRLHNWADTDRWKALRSPKRESADMSVTLYEADGMRRIARMHVAVGKTKVLKAQLRARTAYLVAFRHAGNGFRKARPAADMYYGFRFNFPEEFDAQDCT